MSDSLVEALNNVLESLTDSSDGYAKAAEVADKSRFSDFFARRAEAREKMAGTLRGEIERLGGVPEDSGTILAKAHRVFLSIASTLEESNFSALEAVKTGEIHLRRVVDEAIEHCEQQEQNEIKELLKGFKGEMKADAKLIEKLEEQLGIDETDSGNANAPQNPYNM